MYHFHLLYNYDLPSVTLSHKFSNKTQETVKRSGSMNTFPHTVPDQALCLPLSPFPFSPPLEWIGLGSGPFGQWSK